MIEIIECSSISTNYTRYEESKRISIIQILASNRSGHPFTVRWAPVTTGQKWFRIWDSWGFCVQGHSCQNLSLIYSQPKFQRFFLCRSVDATAKKILLNDDSSHYTLFELVIRAPISPANQRLVFYWSSNSQIFFLFLLNFVLLENDCGKGQFCKRKFNW